MMPTENVPRDSSAPQPQLVQIKNRTVEIVRAGRGEPLVVLESGLGDSWASWRPVLAPLCGRCRVMAYSRPGYGASSEVSTPRDISTEARELHGLLHAMGEEPPYVLVGHSLGGLIVQAFAATHPDEVIGLLLVDAPHPDQIEYLNRDTSAAGSAYRLFAAGLQGVARSEHESLVAPRGGHFEGESALYGGPTIFLCAWLQQDPAVVAYQRIRRMLALTASASYPRAELRKVFCHHYIHHERPLSVIDAVDEILARTRHSPDHLVGTSPTWQLDL